MLREFQERQAIYQDDKDLEDRILMEFAHDLQFLGLLGLKKLVNFRDTLMIEELRRNDVHLCLLSTDSTLDNITDFNAMKLFQDFKAPLNVTGVSEREVEESLKSCLKAIVDRRLLETTSRFSKDESNTGASAMHSRTSRFYSDSENKTKNSSVSSLSFSNLFTERNQDSTDADRKNIMFFNGFVLQQILKDETLMKLFLTIQSLTSVCIGSSVSPL